MHRRTLCGLLTACGLTLTGCLSDVSSSLGRTPEPSKRLSSGAVTATVTDRTVIGTAGAESVTGTVDCEAATATLEGRFSTSSCRTVALAALDVGSDRIEIVVTAPWDESSPPERTDCAGVTYEYRIRLTAREGLPADIDVVHRRPDGRAELQTMVSTGC